MITARNTSFSFVLKSAHCTVLVQNLIHSYLTLHISYKQSTHNKWQALYSVRERE